MWKTYLQAEHCNWICNVVNVQKIHPGCERAQININYYLTW